MSTAGDDSMRCTVCTFSLPFAPWGDSGNEATFDICPCCGTEFGYDDATPAAVAASRKRWLENGATFWRPSDQPSDWSSEEQVWYLKKREASTEVSAGRGPDGWPVVGALLGRPAPGAVMIPPADIPALAARFQRFGALAQAEQLYRQALQNRPGDAELWAGLGRVCQALGRPDEAVTSLRRALALRPADGVLSNDLGVALMEQGRLDEALDCLRAATRLRLDYPEAHHNQGIVRIRQGDPDGAALCFRRALALQPDDPVASCHLGDALAVLGEYDQAVECYRRAVQLRPELDQAWLNLGHALRGLGQHDEAVSCYERAARLRPEDPGPLAELAAMLMHRGELEAAVARYEQALRLWPDCVGAYSNMGLALMALGRLEEARLSFEQALYLQPDLAEAHNNLGLALLNQGRVAEARLRFERAIQLRPDLVDARNNLGLACSAQGEPDRALASFEHAVRIDPDHFGALTNLANACKDQGRAAEAIAYYRQALASRPDDAPVHSNLLLAMHYQPGADPREILVEARRYARQHAEPLAGAIEPRPTRSPAGRRLRIGYVSADFREHPVVSFLEPIVAAHDRHRFEIFCYADVSRPDAITRRLQGYADCWRSLVGLSDCAGRRADPPGRHRDPGGPGRSYGREPATGVRPQAGAHPGVLPGLPGDDRPVGHGLLHHGRSRRPPGPVGGALPGVAHPLARVRVLLRTRPRAGGPPRAAGPAVRPGHLRLLEQPGQGLGRGPGRLVAWAGGCSRLPPLAPHRGRSLG